MESTSQECVNVMRLVKNTGGNIQDQESSK